MCNDIVFLYSALKIFSRAHNILNTVLVERGIAVILGPYLFGSRELKLMKSWNRILRIKMVWGIFDEYEV